MNSEGKMSFHNKENSNSNYDRRPRLSAHDRRIQWAQGMTNKEICDHLQGKLLEARAIQQTTTSLLTELVHEMKYRISVSDYKPRKYRGRQDNNINTSSNTSDSNKHEEDDDEWEYVDEDEEEEGGEGDKK